jgi:hypothetical protein
MKTRRETNLKKYPVSDKLFDNEKIKGKFCWSPEGHYRNLM